MSTDDDRKVKLTLKGAGLAFERIIDAAVAAHVIHTVLQDEPNLNIGANAVQRGPRLSFREFLDHVQPKSNSEKIAAFAGYLRDHVGQEDASKDEIKTCFRTAGDALPGNFHRDFQNTIQSGWIAEDPAKPGRFYLTRKGEDFVSRR